MYKKSPPFSNAQFVLLIFCIHRKTKTKTPKYIVCFNTYVCMYECVLVCKCLPLAGVFPLSLPPSLSIPQYDDVSFRIGMFYFIFPYPSFP